MQPETLHPKPEISHPKIEALLNWYDVAAKEVVHTGGLVKALQHLTYEETDHAIVAELVMELLPALAARTSVVGEIAEGVLDLYVRAAPFASSSSKQAFVDAIESVRYRGELVEAFEDLQPDEQEQIPELFHVMHIHPEYRPIEPTISEADPTTLLEIGEDPDSTADRIAALGKYLKFEKADKSKAFEALLEIGGDPSILPDERITALHTILLEPEVDAFHDQAHVKALGTLVRISGINPKDTELNTDPASAVEAAEIIYRYIPADNLNPACIARVREIADNERLSDDIRVDALLALHTMDGSEIENHPAYQRWTAPITPAQVGGALTHIIANPFPPLTLT